MWHMTKSKNSTPSALEGDFRERKSNPLPEWLNDRPASHCEVVAEGWLVFQAGLPIDLYLVMKIILTFFDMG